MLDGNDLPHELLLTTKQKTKLRNAFNNNMSTDIKHSKTQISKIIISGGFLGSITGSGVTTLIISNEEMNDTMKIARTFEDSNIFLKGVTKTIREKTKGEKGGFLSMLLGTVGASLFGDLLLGKGIVRAGYGNKKETGQ